VGPTGQTDPDQQSERRQRPQQVGDHRWTLLDMALDIVFDMAFDIVFDIVFDTVFDMVGPS
jgi:hypothetical protein